MLMVRLVTLLLMLSTELQENSSIPVNYSYLINKMETMNTFMR